MKKLLLRFFAWERAAQITLLICTLPIIVGCIRRHACDPWSMFLIGFNLSGIFHQELLLRTWRRVFSWQRKALENTKTSADAEHIEHIWQNLVKAGFAKPGDN